MAKKTAVVKLSGNLIGRKDVLDWLRNLSKTYSVRICTGGGEQINAEFIKRGWPVKFGLLGRKTENKKQQQAARDVLEDNAADVEDLLDEKNVNGRVFIPVLDNEVGGILCHVNGDMMPFAVHNGCDKIFVLTLRSRVAKKREFFEDMWAVFVKHAADNVDRNSPCNIEVVGFPDLGTM